MATAAAGQGVFFTPGCVFGKMALPQALHRQPATGNENDPGYSCEITT
jgi:hypothetical protein